MKKLMALVLAFILCCGAATVLAESFDLSDMTEEELRQLRTDIDAELSARAVAQRLEGGTLLEGDLGDYYVALTDIQRGTSGDKPCVILTFQFQNNSETASSFTFAIAKTVYQNGVECEMAFLTTPAIDNRNTLMDVKDGGSIEVQTAFELYDAESPIEIELKELFNWMPNAPTLSGIFAIPE